MWPVNDLLLVHVLYIVEGLPLEVLLPSAAGSKKK